MRRPDAVYQELRRGSRVGFIRVRRQGGTWYRRWGALYTSLDEKWTFVLESVRSIHNICRFTAQRNHCECQHFMQHFAAFYVPNVPRKALRLFAEPVWRNGRAWDSGPRGDGFETRGPTGFSLEPGNQSTLLGGPVRWECVLSRALTTVHSQGPPHSTQP